MSTYKAITSSSTFMTRILKLGLVCNMSPCYLDHVVEVCVHQILVNHI